MSRAIIKPEAGAEVSKQVVLDQVANQSSSVDPARRREAPLERQPRSWGVQASLLAVATVVISLGNYGFSLVMVRLLSPEQFSRFSAAQGLLLVIGNGCMAAIPWAIARYISLGDSPETRRASLHFGFSAAAVQGVIAAPIAGIILGLTAGPGVGLMTAAGTFALSVVVVPMGFLQGVDRLTAVAGLRLVEWAVRAGVSTLAVLLVQRNAVAGIVGYPVGSLVLLVTGTFLCRSGFPLVRGDRSVVRTLLAQSMRLGAIQIFLAMLGALDTVAVLAAGLSTRDAAAYEAAALIGRVPLFMSTAIGTAAYTHLAKAEGDEAVRADLSKALVLYAAITLPFLLICWTVPQFVLGHVLPSSYTLVKPLLLFTSVSGAAIGFLNVVSTTHQARGKFRSATTILGIAAVIQPLALIIAGRTLGIWGFGSTLILVSVGAAVALGFDAAAWMRFSVDRRLVGTAVAACALVALASVAGTVVWVGAVLLIGVVGLAGAWWLASRRGGAAAFTGNPRGQP